MKKSKTTIIIFLGLIALLLVGLVIALLIPSSKDITSSDNGSILLFDKQGLVPEYISVKNDSGEYELLGFAFNEGSPVSEGSEEASHSLPDGTDIVYTMQDHYKYLLDKEITDSLVKQCSILYASEIVDKSSSRYGEYGLDNPVGSFTVSFSDESGVKVDIGDFAPDNKGIYIRLEGDSKVYLANTSDLSSFFIEKLQLFDKGITGTISEVTGFTVSGEFYNEEIKVKENSYKCYPYKFMLDDGARNCCSNSVTETIFKGVQSLKGEMVAAVDTDEEELARLGLDKPFIRVQVTGKGGQSIDIIASKTNENGTFNLMEVGKGIAYTFSRDNASWYAVPKNEILSESVFSVDSSEIKLLKTTADKDSQTYNIEKEIIQVSGLVDNEIITVKCGDKIIPYTNISVFMLDLSRLARTASVPQDLKGFDKTILEVQLGYFSYPEINDDLKLVRNSDGITAAVLNGTVICLVNSSDADKLADQAKLISTSNNLEPVIEQS